MSKTKEPNKQPVEKPPQSTAEIGLQAVSTLSGAQTILGGALCVAISAGFVWIQGTHYTLVPVALLFGWIFVGVGVSKLMGGNGLVTAILAVVFGFGGMVGTLLVATPKPEPPPEIATEPIINEELQRLMEQTNAMANAKVVSVRATHRVVLQPANTSADSEALAQLMHAQPLGGNLEMVEEVIQRQTWLLYPEDGHLSEDTIRSTASKAGYTVVRIEVLPTGG